LVHGYPRFSRREGIGTAKFGPTECKFGVEIDSLAERGRLMAGLTCGDWTSSSAGVAAQVGHSDGLGPNGDTSGTLSSWNSAHANANCADTAPRGGAGRIYCFAR